jgi:DNA-binding transcriptional ArsR family regulator
MVYKLNSFFTMATQQLDRTFAALADPTRRAILARLMHGDALLKDLAEPFDMSVPAVGKHLKVLVDAGLVSRRQEAQRRPCHLEAEPLRAAVDWLSEYRRFWELRHEQLDAVLADLATAGD